MGLIKAAVSAAGSALADQWLEVIEPDDMGEQTVFVKGVQVRKGKGSNTKGSSNTVSNGSVIHVYDNQFMILTDGGKIIDYTAEPGYFTVDNSSLPSMFDGSFQDALHEAFSRFKYGGTTPTSQQVFYVNLQEIKGLRFGTKNAINYFDNFYNAELFLRCHGDYSIKITDPIKFYAEVVPRNAEHLEMNDINEQYLSEFLEALQSAINQMSADGTRISFVTSKSRELGKYMADVLDDDWTKNRGMQVQSVGIASISYDEESQKLINMRNKGAMMSDPTIREGFVQSSIAEGIQNAGSNPNGGMAGFMGVGMGMQAGGSFMSGASAANMQQMQMNQAAMQQQMAAQQMAAQQAVPQQAAPQQMAPQAPAPQAAAPAEAWTCACGTANTGKFCSNCGQPKPATDWTCACGTVNKGNFCSNCGKSRQ